MVFAVIVAAIIYVLPTFKPDLWPHKKINLGLDLQGGMHLVLELDQSDRSFTGDEQTDAINRALETGWSGPVIGARFGLDEIVSAHQAVEGHKVKDRVVIKVVES